MRYIPYRAGYMNLVPVAAEHLVALFKNGMAEDFFMYLRVIMSLL